MCIEWIMFRERVYVYGEYGVYRLYGLYRRLEGTHIAEVGKQRKVLVLELVLENRWNILYARPELVHGLLPSRLCILDTVYWVINDAPLSRQETGRG